MPRAAAWIVALGIVAAAPATAQPVDDANVHPLDVVEPDPPVKAQLLARRLRCPKGATQRMEVDSTQGRIWCEDADGAAEGPFESWSAAGRLLESGSRKAGALHGTYREWWGEGEPRVEARFVDGAPDGDYREWDAAGETVARGSYRRGRQHGRWKVWRRDDGDSLYLQGEHGYYFGAPHGRWWSRDRRTGVQYDVRFHRGRLHGAWFVHIDYRDGDQELELEGRFEHGRRHGRWLYRERRPRDLPRAKRVVARFDHGVPHGRWELWTDGALTGSTTYSGGSPVREDAAVPHETIFDFDIDDTFDDDALRGRW